MTTPPPLTPAQRLKIDRHAIPVRDAEARSHDFTEVATGYDAELACEEAQRCLGCKDAACVNGCPVGVDIPGFVTALARGDHQAAVSRLRARNCLPAVTGRVCPQETQCEAMCIRGKRGAPVAIGALERYVSTLGADTTPAAAPTGKKIAVVGSGPGGLAAAGALARRGHAVTVFEAFHTPGGVLVYGIPEFRLPKQIVAQEVAGLEALGVTVECNVVIGRTITMAELRQDYDAMFLAVGAGLPVFLGVPGENLRGVYAANEYLTRVNLMGAWSPDAATPVLRGKRVVVVGGGNVAMDAVRTARRLGADEATIVYRREHKDLPARHEEIEHAEEEGIRFAFLKAPVAILDDGNGAVGGFKVQGMRVTGAGADGRQRIEAIPGDEQIIPCDLVVAAIGSRANPLLTATCPDLTLDRRGNIVVDANGMTSIPGVFAGGDIVRGAATVILAMGDGVQAGETIHRYLETCPATRAP